MKKAYESDITDYLYFDVYKATYKVIEPIKNSGYFGNEIHKKIGKFCRAIDLEDNLPYRTTSLSYEKIHPKLEHTHPLFPQYGNGAPPPFIVTLPSGMKQINLPGDTFSLLIILIGNACQNDHLWYRIMKKMKEKGPQQSKIILTGWEQIMDYPCQKIQQLKNRHGYTGDLTICFETPFEWTNIQINNNSLSFSNFYHWLFRRMYHLTYIYCNINTLKDSETYKNKPSDIKINEINMKAIKYPYQSGSKIKAKGGYIGHVIYSGNFTPYLSLLQLGQYLHIGRSTSMGYGKYHLHYKED